VVQLVNIGALLLLKIVRRSALLLSAASLLGSSPAIALPIHLSTVTAPEVSEACGRPRDLLAGDFCAGYIVGVWDALSLSGAVCGVEGFSTEQAVAVGRKYLGDHPERWNTPPVVLLRDAFTATFPCPARR
jgi:hypothetical protein